MDPFGINMLIDNYNFKKDADNSILNNIPTDNYAPVNTKTKKITKERNLPKSVTNIATGKGLFECYPNIEELTGYNVLKICFAAKIIESQKTSARNFDNTPSIKSTPPELFFWFIAPNEIIETVSHQWEPYDSIASKIAELASTGSKYLQEFNNVANRNTMQNIYKNLTKQSSDLSWGNALVKKASGVGKSLSGGTVVNTRVDMPLVYKNSERRRFEFTFPLSIFNINKDNDILTTVRALECLSCPTLPADKPLAEVKPPCIFEIYTIPDGLITVNNAALVTVQPTFKGPYIDGKPSTCDLHLAFQELDPLWDSVFNTSAYSKVISTETINNKDITVQNKQPKKQVIPPPRPIKTNNSPINTGEIW